ncbi:MAG: sigma factor [Acidimicrobiales bacterium]
MSETDDDPTGSVPAQGDDDGPESSVELEGRVDWDEKNRELFAERKRIALQLEELGSLGDTDRVSTGSMQEIGLRHELVDNCWQIIKTNDGLVKHYVRKFTDQSRPEQSDDYSSAGLVGLVEAINKFDSEKGSFFRFAQIYVRREVQKAVQNEEHNNIGSRDFEKRPIVLLTYRQLQDDLGVESPSAEEVAAKSGVPLARVKRILNARPSESLDAPLGYEKFANRKNQERKEEYWDSPSTEATWFEHLKSVTEDLDIREFVVLIRREGLDGWQPESIASLSGRLDIGRESIRRAEMRARKSIEEKGFPVPRDLE